jgi:hypothetical protein
VTKVAGRETPELKSDDRCFIFMHFYIIVVVISIGLYTPFVKIAASGFSRWLSAKS